MCKKYHENFTKDEKNLIVNMISKIVIQPEIRIHALLRMYQKKIPSEWVYDVLKDYEIIEYNQVCGEHRVLLRGNNTYKNRNIVISLDLLANEIVTVYSNAVTDNHNKLNSERYVKNIDIIKEIQRSYSI